MTWRHIESIILYELTEICNSGYNPLEKATAGVFTFIPTFLHHNTNFKLHISKKHLKLWLQTFKTQLNNEVVKK